MRTRQRIVPVKVIISLEVVPDRLQVHQHIIELFQEEEAAGHALPAWDGVALGWGGTDQLEQLLRGFEVFSWVLLLPVHRVDDTLQDVFSWGRGLDVFDQVEGFGDLLLF